MSRQFRPDGLFPAGEAGTPHLPQAGPRGLGPPERDDVGAGRPVLSALAPFPPAHPVCRLTPTASSRAAWAAA